MLLVHCYTDRTTLVKKYSVLSFHNNRYAFKGYFDEDALNSFLNQSQAKHVYISNVKTKRDLKPQTLEI